MQFAGAVLQSTHPPGFRRVIPPKTPLSHTPCARSAYRRDDLICALKVGWRRHADEVTGLKCTRVVSREEEARE